jgi:hypothetical protein
MQGMPRNAMDIGSFGFNWIQLDSIGPVLNLGFTVSPHSNVAQGFSETFRPLEEIQVGRLWVRCFEVEIWC